MNRRKFIYNSSLASLSVMGLSSCNLNSKNLKITILHTNDVHSQIEPFPPNHNRYPNKGGFAKRAGLFKEIIDQNPNTLIGFWLPVNPLGIVSWNQFHNYIFGEQNKSKLIELDDDGKFKQISFSGRLDYVPYLNQEKLKTFYKARKYMYELCNSDQFKIKFRLSKGMIAMFDNLRTLHGRTKFDPNTGFRHLQGCYIDHDSTEGKLRRLLK